MKKFGWLMAAVLALAASGARADVARWNAITRCSIDGKLLDPQELGFWQSNKKGKAVDRVEIELQQLQPTGEAPVSYRSRLQLSARDSAGALVDLGDWSRNETTTWRLAVHKLGDALAIAYDPGEARGGFLLTIEDKSASFNFIPKMQSEESGFVVKPVPADCKSVGNFVAIGEKNSIADRLTGSNLEKCESMDTFLDRRSSSIAWDYAPEFGVDKAEWDKRLEAYGKTIEKIYGESPCAKKGNGAKVNALRVAKNANGKILGYRLDVYCDGILSKSKDDYKRKAKGTSIYFDEKKHEIEISDDDRPRLDFAGYFQD